ncbi:MAG: homoserine kinase, partial [Anaerolineae bacterium]
TECLPIFKTMEPITVTIPATTANLGPGFDCLGLALALYNDITLTAVPGNLHIIIEGEGADELPADESNLVYQAAARVFDWVGKRPSGLRNHQRNRIPGGSGLGSSAAATLGGIVAANGLVGGGLTDGEILRLATEMERHPDNVVPAFYGGLTLAVMGDDGRPHVEQIPVTPMQVVIVLPDFDLPTAEARAALPASVPLADAVFNIGRAGLVMRALERGDWAALTLAMRDRLHQPYRVPLIPGMAAAFTAAREAGAAAVALSGAGPSAAAFAPNNHQAIARAMQEAFTAVNLPSRAWILPIAPNPPSP